MKSSHRFARTVSEPDLRDTSALLKIYVDEGDSREFVALMEGPGSVVWTSAITAVEVRCALNLKEYLGKIQKADVAGVMRQFARDCANNRICRVPYDEEITRQAQAVVDFARVKRRSLMIRSLDAIQVATALSIRADRIVTTDARMREVAAMMNLKAIPSR